MSRELDGGQLLKAHRNNKEGAVGDLWLGGGQWHFYSEVYHQTGVFEDYHLEGQTLTLLRATGPGWKQDRTFILVEGESLGPLHMGKKDAAGE